MFFKGINVDNKFIHCVLHIIFCCANTLLVESSGLCFSSDPRLLQTGATGKVSDLYSLSEGKRPVGARLGPNKCHCHTCNFFLSCSSIENICCGLKKVWLCLTMCLSSFAHLNLTLICILSSVFQPHRLTPQCRADLFAGFKGVSCQGKFHAQCFFH